LGPFRSISGRVDLTFLFLVAGVFLINLPYFNPLFIPQHDTLYNFHIFYFFYNEYFFRHTIAQWMPYGAYGMPAALFQLGVLSPAEYLTGFWGACFGVKDVMFLFKISALLDQLTFLLGMYYLARMLFEKRMIVLFVCIASFCSMEWAYQIFWNLRIHEFFPLALYFLFLFFERKRSVYFWMLGIIGILWSLGIWFYMSFMFFFLGCTVFAVLFIYDHDAWKYIWPRRRLDAVVMCLFFVLAAVYVLIFKSSFEHIAVLHRSSTSGAANSLKIFLTHGRNASFDSVISWFLYRAPLHTFLGAGKDNTAYVGFSTVIFFIWALVFVRNKYFVAIVAAFFVLLGMSFGGMIAHLTYYFPGMKFYRHIGLVYPIIKVCVALGAGFGLADFLKCPRELRIRRLLLTLGICLWVMDADNSVFKDKSIIISIMIMYFMAFLIWLGIRCVLKIWSRNTEKPVPIHFLEYAFAVLLMGALCIEVFMFQKDLCNGWPALPPKVSAGFESVGVNECPYVKQRGQEPAGRQALAFLLQKGAINGFSAQYESVYTFAQSEPCDEIPKSGVLTVYVNEFLNSKILNNDQRKRILGCTAPKVRLLGNEVGDQQELGVVSVKDFTTDNLVISADIKKKEGAQLFYADSFYPGWNAYVDGTSTTVNKAFTAFKSVFVPQGRHEVRLVFVNTLTFVLSYMLAFLALIAGAGTFYFLLATLCCSKGPWKC